MTSVRISLILLLISLLTNCVSESKRHYAQWDLLVEKQLLGIIKISERHIELHSCYVNKCDTVFEPLLVLQIKNEATKGNKTEISAFSDEGSTNLFLSFENDDKGEICLSVEGERLCGTFKRSNIVISKKLSKEEKELNDYRFTISTEISSTQFDINRLKRDNTLSNETSSLLAYIDSLEKNLLLQYNLNYSEVECWNKLDSLTCSYTSTDFMLGNNNRNIDSKYNGYVLEKKLIDYLIEQSNDKLVKTLFPTFKGIDFLEYDRNNKMISWSVNSFHQASLGITIIELEKLKLKIIQLDIITQNQN